MLTLVAIPLTCWLCALIALPRKPRVGNEVAELAYARLLGRQQRLTLLALLLTGAAVLALVAGLPSHLDPKLQARRDARRICATLEWEPSHCPVQLPDGRWVYAEAFAVASARPMVAARVQRSGDHNEYDAILDAMEQVGMPQPRR